MLCPYSLVYSLKYLNRCIVTPYIPPPPPQHHTYNFTDYKTEAQRLTTCPTKTVTKQQGSKASWVPPRRRGFRPSAFPNLSAASGTITFVFIFQALTCSLKGQSCEPKVTTRKVSLVSDDKHLKTPGGFHARGSGLAASRHLAHFQCEPQHRPSAHAGQTPREQGWTWRQADGSPVACLVHADNFSVSDHGAQRRRPRKAVFPRSSPSTRTQLLDRTFKWKVCFVLSSLQRFLNLLPKAEAAMVTKKLILYQID